MFNYPDKRFRSCIPEKDYKDYTTKRIVNYLQDKEYIIYKDLKNGTHDPTERALLSVHKETVEAALTWIHFNIR